jgi:arylsulfatase A-like enzyme
MSADRRPNVIVFFTDQQRWDTLGDAGNPTGLTPNLDHMAKRATVFEVACASNPVCAPSRAAILTGRYPTETGVYQNGIPLSPSIPTMAKAFHDAGYRTGYIGKWHLSESNPVPAAERADFDFWLASNLLEFTSDAYRTVVYDGDDQPVELPGYRADALTDAAIRFVADHSDPDGPPFFLFVSFLEPHHQNEKDDYPAPEVYRDAFKDGWMPPDLAALGGTSPQHLAGYYGQVKRLDECLGRLRDALLSLELADSTMLAYTSDHGSHFKTRNGEYKRSCHDSSIRVPLLIEGPGFDPGLRITRPVTTADVAPTLLRAAAVPTPEGMRAEGLLASTGDAVLIQVSEAETGRALRTPRWKYHVVADPDTRAGAADRYREEGLYDLDADPYELDNLIGSTGHRSVADELRARLIERIRDVEQAESRIEPYAGELREERFTETVVRSSGLRGSRFGHQAVEVHVP